jgi:hypothetical protein
MGGTIMQRTAKLSRTAVGAKHYAVWDAFQAVLGAAMEHNRPLQNFREWRQMVGFWGSFAQFCASGKLMGEHCTKFSGLVERARDKVSGTGGRMAEALFGPLEALKIQIDRLA